MIVEEVMSRDPYTATVTTSVRQGLRMLAEADIRHLPVTEKHALVGIVSDRDLRSVLPSPLLAIDHTQEVERALAQPIANVMNSDVVFVHPESELGEAVDLMLEHKIGAIPVVEADSLKLVGIVSYVDALRVARDLL